MEVAIIDIQQNLNLKSIMKQNTPKMIIITSSVHSNFNFKPKYTLN